MKNIQKVNPQSYPIQKPDLLDVLQLLKEDIMTTLRVCVPGQVVSFNGTKRTAVIKILLKRTLADGTYADYGNLQDVPIYTPGAGGAFLLFPIAPGDQGIVVFADRNIGGWIQNGTIAPLPDMRAHSLSDGIFIPGLNAYSATVPAYSTSKTVLTYQGSTLELDPAGIKLIGNGGAEIDLQTTFATIKNATTSLGTLINALITAIEGIEVTGNLPLTAPSIAALEAVRTEFEALIT
jgi:Phage protein Gp138 N-terminal domain